MSEEVMLSFAEQFDAIFDGPKLDIIDQIFAPDFVGHLPLVSETNRDGWKHYVANLYKAVSDLITEINEVIVGEDRLVLRMTFTGTHDGPLFRVQATGLPVLFEGMGIFRLDEDGLVAEAWAVVDLMGLLAQIGGLSTSES